MRNLLENIEGKIKVLAAVRLVLGSMGVLAGLAALLIWGYATRHICLLAGGVVLLLDFLPMYAVGEIAEQVRRQSWQNERILSALKEMNRAEQADACDAAQQKNESEWHCLSCGRLNAPAATCCRHCGKDG